MSSIAPFYVDRLMSRRAGFRAKISNAYYVFIEGERWPVDGPFADKAIAFRRATIMKHEHEQNKGQSKTHEATRTNPTTGEVETRTFTQAEWKARDKSEGWTRPDDVDGDEAEDGAADEPSDPGGDPGSTPVA